MRRVVAGLVVVLGALSPLSPAVAASATTALSDRAYDATALAVPLDPRAGSHGSPIPVRLFTTRADVSNPPSAASARAARTDLGLLEQFVPAQALGPAADSSTRDSNSPHNARTSDGPALYVSHADPSPAASATATATDAAAAGADVGWLRSTSDAVQANDVVTATVTTAMHELTLGPLHVRAASYHAVASVDDRHGLARAAGAVTLVGAEVAGVPVVVTQDGVQVDTTKVPASQVDDAAKAVAEAFAATGFLDVRVLQPTLTRHGSSATASGGGVQLIARSDSQSSYYIATTVLSGSVSAAAGDTIASVTQTPVLPNLGLEHMPTGVSSPLGPPYTPPATGSLPPTAARARALPTLVAGSRSDDVRLPTTWSGWPVLLALALACLAATAALQLRAATPVRRRLLAMAGAIADRYVRG